MDIKDWFITLYFNKLRNSQLFKNMESVEENSPWHREGNVLIHTDMVVSQLLHLNPDAYDRAWLLAALACAFHDVGKPSSIEYKHSEERGDYKSFGGHELVSARLWEDFAVSNWELFEGRITASEIAAVAWLIEQHLPYKLKKEHKLNNMFIHNTVATNNALQKVLVADCWGRISDDHNKKKDDVAMWINNFQNDQENIKSLDAFYARAANISSNKTLPIMYMLIGASGSGKSTYTNKLGVEEVYSLDKLRLAWYDKEDYSKAYQMSCEDSSFNARAQAAFMDIVKAKKNVVVDNVNISTKRRRFYIDGALRNGYKTVAVVFPIDIQTIVNRQATRGDKNVPESAVRSQYMGLQQPSYGEFDQVHVIMD